MHQASPTIHFSLNGSERLRVAPVFELSEAQEAELTRRALCVRVFACSRVRGFGWRCERASCCWPRGAPPVKVDVQKRVELTTQSKPEAVTH